jgi:hypothetical protein
MACFTIEHLHGDKEQNFKFSKPLQNFSFLSSTILFNQFIKCVFINYLLSLQSDYIFNLK